ELIAPHELGVVLLLVVAEQRHLDLRRIFDVVVVREDVAILADDEAGARGARGLRTPLIAAAVPVAAATLILLLAGAAEESMEEIVGRAPAAKEVGEVLGPGFHLSADVHHGRPRPLG